MNTLFIAAHPDDIETMMGFAVLQEAGHCFALIATDGERSTRNFTPHKDFVTHHSRRGESRRGLGVLGIPPHRQQYLRLPDCELAVHAETLTKAVSASLSKHQITQLFTLGPHGFDGHTDHVATYAAALAASQAGGRPVRVYALDHQQRGMFVIPAIELARKLKIRAMACHRSQFAIEAEPGTAPSRLLDGFAIPSHCWRHLRPYRQLLLKAETYDIV